MICQNTITYDTAPDKVEKAVAIIKEILNEHEGMHPDFPPRVYFNGFNDEGIDFAFPSHTVYLANDDQRQLKLKMLAGETVTYTPDGNAHE